jgi:hypothetical protein
MKRSKSNTKFSVATLKTFIETVHDFHGFCKALVL